MNLFARIVLFGFLVPFLIPVVGHCQSETTAPPLTFELTVNGKAQTIEVDKEFEIDLKGKTSFKLKASPNRHFKFAGLSFPYPKALAFEAEIEEALKLWTLDGVDCVMMIFAFPDDDSVGHAGLAKNIGAQFGRGTRSTETSLKGKGLSLVGTEIRANVLGQGILMEVFQIPTEDGSRFIVVQDSLEEDGSHSKEFENVKTLLKKRLKIPSPSIGLE